MLSAPSLTGLNWTKARTLAREQAAAHPVDEVVALATALLASPESIQRLYAVYLLGFTSDKRPANLALLHERAVPDENWEVQEALAQAFDRYCAAPGYEAALPTIDAWLADAHANARRAVSEGLRPWTAKNRAYFSQHPIEAIRRLAPLRHDVSDYVRHSAGNALRDIRRTHPELVENEIATWNLADPKEFFTYQRVLKAR